MQLRETIDSFLTPEEGLYVDLDERVKYGSLLLACSLKPDECRRDIHSYADFKKTIYWVNPDHVFDADVKVGLCSMEEFFAGVPFSLAEDGGRQGIMSVERAAKLKCLIASCVSKMRNDVNVATRWIPRDSGVMMEDIHRWLQSDDDWLRTRECLSVFKKKKLRSFGHWLVACFSVQQENNGKVTISLKLLIRALSYIVSEKDVNERNALLGVLEGYAMSGSCESCFYRAMRAYLGKEYDYHFYGEAESLENKDIVVSNVKMVYEFVPHEFTTDMYPFGGVVSLQLEKHVYLSMKNRYQACRVGIRNGNSWDFEVHTIEVASGIFLILDLLYHMIRGIVLSNSGEGYDRWIKTVRSSPVMVDSVNNALQSICNKIYLQSKLKRMCTKMTMLLFDDDYLRFFIQEERNAIVYEAKKEDSHIDLMRIMISLLVRRSESFTEKKLIEKAQARLQGDVLTL